MRRRLLHRKPLCCLAALALLLWLSALPAFAEGETDRENDYTYSGELDPETGSAPGGSSAAEDAQAEISPGMGYDSAREMFAYALSDGTELLCSAADGMLVTEPVTLSYDGASALTVYRNGETVDSSETVLRTPGVYAVAVGSDTAARVCSFTILGAATNQIRSYSVPEGFLLRGAERNGEEIDYSRYTVEMEQEGQYVIQYRCPLIDRDYTLRVTIDRTPPNLLLSGSVGADGRVHSAVEVSGLEAGDTLYITHDGEPVALTLEEGKGKLTDTGVYSVTAADAAGNAVTYEFTIMLYLNTNAIVFILLLFAVVVSIFVYAFWKRRTLKVR